MKQLYVLENLYHHEGARGHEVVFVFEAELLEPAVFSKGSLSFVDGGVTSEVVWRPALRLPIITANRAGSRSRGPT